MFAQTIQPDYFHPLRPQPMSDAFCQINIHLVFAVKGRESLVQEHFREALEQFITAIVQRRGHRMLAIYCMPDHTHVLIGKRPNQSESDLVRDIKSNSSNFIREQGWVDGYFAWQVGYGAFSCSGTHVGRAISYIRNQATHHQKRSFKDEFWDMLAKAGLEPDPRDMFKWIG